MADKPNVNESGDEIVQVPSKVLIDMQEKMAELERKQADSELKTAGLEELLAKDASTEGEPKLRSKKDFSPKFRTVRLRKYPIAGDFTNLGYVIGWTNRGAYQEVDRTGVSPQIVDFIDIIFLGKEKNAEGKLQAEKVRLLDLINKGEQVHCKILKQTRKEVPVPTGEEIDVTVFDPQHGLVSTGEKVDGFITYSDIKLEVQIPGVAEPITIDSSFVN